ncbi:BTAD domain-containing putative transcriptional regulator [Kitasatospora sp. NPDC085464]|uniref:AfsR/SARP family transcriptional regulator n=1 Tax=Kitasatospora sp. NPDC085464 TaxID=3364063 RepID=UPI0037CA1825
MEFSVLGLVSVKDARGAEVGLDGAKQRTVLAALLLARGRVVTDARLSTLLWDWNPPATMSAQIYTYISRLRKRLGPRVRLSRQGPGYQLDIGDTRFDLVEFERLTRQARSALAASRFDAAARDFESALALWQGPALGNVTEALAQLEVPGLEEARTAALEGRVEADLALGRHQRLVPELTSLVTELPLRERLRAQLMTALYRSGRRADALAAYQQGRRILAHEIGVDPGPELTAVHQAVLTDSPELLTGPGGPQPPGARPARTAGPEHVRGRENLLALVHSTLPVRGEDVLAAMVRAGLLKVREPGHDGSPRYWVGEPSLLVPHDAAQCPACALRAEPYMESA